MCRVPCENAQDNTQDTLTPCVKGQSADDKGFTRAIRPKQWPARLALMLIRFYQNAISPHTPPTCFFYPTCSHYTYQAIEQFGFWRGVWLGIYRIGRCHPFARGGYDPVPQGFSWFPTRRVESNHVESHKDLDE